MWNKQAQKARQLSRPAGKQEFCLAFLTYSSDSSSNLSSSAVFISAVWYRSHLPSFVNLFKSMRFEETKYDIPNSHVSNGPPLYMAPPGGQISNKCMWRHLLTKFASYKVIQVLVSTHGSVVPLAMFVCQVYMVWLKGNSPSFQLYFSLLSWSLVNLKLDLRVHFKCRLNSENGTCPEWLLVLPPWPGEVAWI